ncbi:MAG: response regulator [Comamonadaceae bacterium]|nr:MAG: response regulator [Comamonadaceae bacterium]
MTTASPKIPITILAVEDEAPIRMLLAEFIEEMGHSAVMAADGEDAITQLAKHDEVDLLITDIRMPGMSGLDLAWLARTKRPEVPIVFITGYAPELNDTPLAQEAHTAVLTKPFTLEQLRAAVRRALGN